MTTTATKFIICSEYAELLDVAMRLKDDGHEVVFYVEEHEYRKIGEGIVKKTTDPWPYMGKGYIWVFDGCARGERQDWLRSKGEFVIGGSEKGDKLENERQLAQDWFKAAGFQQVESKNFNSLDKAISFVENNRDRRWVLKQNGDAPKSINHIGKFDGNEDMLFHLEGLKSRWNESEYGVFDCDIMEFVDGLEVAASAFFNGTDFLKNKDGKVVGFLNFEDKKEADGNTGETTGEMGTTFIGVTEDNPLFKDILLRPKIIEVLRKIGFRGVFDINCIKTSDGIVALEPTMRFGVPATSYEFMEGLLTPLADLLVALAKGQNLTVEVRLGTGMVLVVAAKPYPTEADVAPEATSLGEKLWILKDKKPVKDFSPEQKKHIHLENFEKKDGYYCVASKNGYLLTVTGVGDTIKDTRETLLQYLKDNLYLAGMKYRTDIGKRVEDALGESKKKVVLMESTQKEEKKKAADETYKKKLQETLYGAH